MKKFLFAAALFTVSVQSFGQATMQDLEKLRTIHNSETCLAFKQPSTCTMLPEIEQNGVMVPNPNILYPDTNAGRLACERVYAKVVVDQILQRYAQVQEAKRLEKSKARWDLATPAERDRFCQIRGEDVGCDPFTKN